MTREEAIFILERDNLNNITIRSGFESLYDQRKEAFSMAIKALEQEPTTKNDLVVDCISKVDALSDKGLRIGEYHFYEDYAKMRSHLKSLPSVIPHVPTTKNDLAVDCISRQAVIEITAETGALETQARVKALPSVTPIRPKGHWIDREVYDADRWKCSECGRTEQWKENYCPNCGADMKEVEE